MMLPSSAGREAVARSGGLHLQSQQRQLLLIDEDRHIMEPRGVCMTLWYSNELLNSIDK